jgi:hypothetical protein
VGEVTETFRVVACEILRALLDRTFGVRIVEGSLVGVMSPGVEEKSPSGADLKLMFSSATAAPSSEPSPEGILSSFGRLIVFRAYGCCLMLADGLMVLNTHSSSTSSRLTSRNVSS